MVFARRLEKTVFFLSPQKLRSFSAASLALLRCLSRHFRPRRDARRSFCRDCWEAEKKRERGRASGRKTHVEDSPWRRANEEKSEEGRRSSEAERRRKQKKTLLLSSSPASPSLFPLPLFLSPSLSLSTHTGHAKENENHTGSVGQSVSQNTRGHGSA